MAYCSKCGNQLDDNVNFCPKCGANRNGVSSQSYWQQNYRRQTNYGNQASLRGSTLGFVLTFFLGIIGFVLCYILGDEECKETAKKTFIICLVIGVFCAIIYGCAVGSMIGNAYY